jgi:hypothetical protein
MQKAIGNCAAASLEAAIFGIEEHEESAKLVLFTRGLPVRRLSAEDIADLNASFKLRRLAGAVNDGTRLDPAKAAPGRSRDRPATFGQTF